MAPCATSLLLLCALLTGLPAPAAALVDWTAVQADLSALFRADLRLATAALRLSFHACGTYDAGAGSGGVQCAAQLNASSPANLGLATVFPPLLAVQRSYAGASVADVFTLASVVAVAEMYGPAIPWRAGRVDLACVPNAEALLPDAMTDGYAGGVTRDTAPPSANTFAPAAVRAKFARMGLSDADTVALMGAHTVGHAHFGTGSGFFGAWCVAGGICVAWERA
jgi:cytochrome c peroxidase